MTKKTANVKSTHQSLTPEQQQQQLVYLEPFYNRLIGMTFDDSAVAIEQCRELCAEYGFTVKQEASTHRNIYVYCSREGLPDSLRNPKSNPQRKRPSKRCDCRWRVVLYENEQHQWEFRKSLNPEAGKHNHELMNPDEVERSWPKEVTDLICELARQRLTTQEIRNRVRDQFPNIHWNERRFYNRLSEERQKIKLRDTVDRTYQLNQIWSQVCTASAGNDDLFQYVKQELDILLQSICDTSQIEPESLPPPSIQQTEEKDNNAEQSQPSKSTSLNAPKGYLSIEMPKQVCYIKIHNQRQLNDTQVLRKRPRDDTTLDTRKIVRKGKGRQVASNLDMLIPYRSSVPGNMLVPITPRQPQPMHTQTTFIYYDSSMSIDTTSLNYPFPNNYSPTTTPQFSDMNFAYNENNATSSSSTPTEPVIHTALHTMVQREESTSKEQQQPSQSSPSPSTSTFEQQQTMFSLHMYQPPKDK